MGAQSESFIFISTLAGLMQPSSFCQSRNAAPLLNFLGPAESESLGVGFIFWF